MGVDGQSGSGFFTMVVSDRFGLGNRLTAANIDKWTLLGKAQYCDQPVPR